MFPGRHPQGDAGAEGGLRVRDPLGDAVRALQEGEEHRDRQKPSNIGYIQGGPTEF